MPCFSFSGSSPDTGEETALEMPMSIFIKYLLSDLAPRLPGIECFYGRLAVQM